MLTRNHLSFIANKYSDQLTEVTKLDLSGHLYKSLDFAFVFSDEFSNLTSLNISHNCLQVFPACLRGLPKLSFLNASNNELVSIEGISTLTNLRALLLNSNKLVDCKSEFQPLIELLSLVLSHNELQVFPDVSGNVFLTKLSLSHNKIVSIPPSLSLAKQLTELRCNSNLLNNFPVIKLDRLRLLDLGNNLSLNCSSFDCFYNLNHLENLNLMGSPIDVTMLKHVTVKILNGQKILGGVYVEKLKPTDSKVRSTSKKDLSYFKDLSPSDIKKRKESVKKLVRRVVKKSPLLAFQKKPFSIPSPLSRPISKIKSPFFSARAGSPKSSSPKVGILDMLGNQDTFSLLKPLSSPALKSNSNVSSRKATIIQKLDFVNREDDDAPLSFAIGADSNNSGIKMSMSKKDLKDATNRAKRKLNELVLSNNRTVFDDELDQTLSAVVPESSDKDLKRSKKNPEKQVQSLDFKKSNKPMPDIPVKLAVNPGIPVFTDTEFGVGNGWE